MEEKLSDAVSKQKVISLAIEQFSTKCDLVELLHTRNGAKRPQSVHAVQDWLQPSTYTYTRLTRCQLLSVMLLLFQVFFFITNYMLICKLLLLPCDMHYYILFILCLQTVPGEGEVHIKEEASEFIVSSCTILLFFFILQTKTLRQL